MRNAKIMVIVLLAAALVLAAGPAGARNSRWMRHNGRRVQVGDSVADLMSLFGEPTYKMDLGQLDDGWRQCLVELWVYDFPPWRYELKIAQGRIWRMRKIRLRRVR